MNNNRSKTGNVINNQSVVQRQLKQMKDEMTGCKRIPRSATPTTIVRKPWNNLTIETLSDVAGGVQSITSVQTIINEIASLYHIDAEKIQIKVQHAQVWVNAAVTAGTSIALPQAQATFFELGDNDKNVRSLQRDVGAIGKPAKFGYMFPTSDSKDIFTTTEGARYVLLVEHAGGNTTLSVCKHIRVLWNTSS